MAVRGEDGGADCTITAADWTPSEPVCNSTECAVCGCV